MGRHQGGLCAVFLDGHAKWLKMEELCKKDASGQIYKYKSKILD